MDRTRIFTLAVVAAVILWSAGATAELFVTTLSIGETVVPAAATLAFVALVLLVGVATGAKGPRWLRNPRSYW